MNNKLLVPIVVFSGTVVFHALANNCTKTVPRLDEDGNQITACDLVSPTAPSNECGDGEPIGTTMDEGLTDCLSGQTTGRQSCEIANKYCQREWLVTDAFGNCGVSGYSSAFVGSTRASGVACPAQGPGGIQ